MTRILPAMKLLVPAAATLAIGVAAVPWSTPTTPTEPAAAEPIVEYGETEVDPAEVAWRPDGISQDAWDTALTAYQNANAEGVVQSPILTVVDYSMPSTEERMWVVDMERQEVLFNELVAHGKNSGNLVATEFSNTPDSLQTSLGVFKTAETYHGSRGFSLKLDGLEPGTNDKARDRGIVVHGSDYVNEARAAEGRVGRSWGCPAVDRDVSKELIETIDGGTLFVSYYPDQGWLQKSQWVASAR